MSAKAMQIDYRVIDYMNHMKVVEVLFLLTIQKIYYANPHRWRETVRSIGGFAGLDEFDVDTLMTLCKHQKTNLQWFDPFPIEVIYVISQCTGISQRALMRTLGVTRNRYLYYVKEIKTDLADAMNEEYLDRKEIVLNTNYYLKNIMLFFLVGVEEMFCMLYGSEEKRARTHASEWLAVLRAVYSPRKRTEGMEGVDI